MKKINNFISKIEKKLTVKKKAESVNIRGTYEEVYSNWKNKMSLAAVTHDTYLSFMTAASCQDFYNEFYDEFDMKKIELMKHFNINDLYESAEAFNKDMEDYRTVYKENGIEIDHYDTIDEFEKDYLGK